MSYMAVGSRQILFSDSHAPALAGEKTSEIASFQDNSSSEQTERIKATAERPAGNPAAPPAPGDNLDLLA